MMKLQVKHIELFGAKLLLSERLAKDVFELAEFARENGDDNYATLLSRIRIIKCALYVNMSLLPWWNILKRLKYKWKFSTYYILNNLSASQIIDLSNIVLEELECVDVSDIKEEDHKPISKTYRLLLVRAATGLSINDCLNLPITFFNEALEFAFNYSSFKRGEQFKLQSYIDERKEIMNLHKMMFPNEWSNN